MTRGTSDEGQICRKAVRLRVWVYCQVNVGEVGPLPEPRYGFPSPRE